MSAVLQASNEPVLLRHDAGGITTVTLNRPKQYNALSEELLSELQSALDSIGDDPSVRVVVIAGNGTAFCAGHDLKQMRANPKKAYYEKLFGQCSKIMVTLTRLPQPVIARVHGIATAAGCQLVAQCDLAVASDNARFAVSGINVALFCSTPSVPLSRNVSRKQAMEMLLTGDFIDATTAKARGMVNRVVPLEKLDAEVQALVDEIFQYSPSAIRLGLEAFDNLKNIPSGDAHAYLKQMLGECIQTPDAAEGVRAFMEKRKPVWK